MVELNFNNQSNTIGAIDFLGIGKISGWVLSKQRISSIELVVEEFDLQEKKKCGVESKEVVYGLRRDDVYAYSKDSEYHQPQNAGFFAWINFFSLKDSFIKVYLKIRIQTGEILCSEALEIQNKDLDAQYLHDDVPLSKEIAHHQWENKLVELANQKGKRILEIGSREVVSRSRRNLFSEAEYVGFDLYDGDNVDVVGDAHKLSSYFDEKFDLIFSTAVFEHLAMPWVVAEEISKLLNPNGYIFIETHYSFSSHERPWHFFQYSEQALKVLFSSALGFECIEAGVSNPIVGRFSALAAQDLQGKAVTGLYCHSEYLGQKVSEVKNFQWDKVDLPQILQKTQYPKE